MNNMKNFIKENINFLILELIILSPFIIVLLKENHISLSTFFEFLKFIFKLIF